MTSILVVTSLVISLALVLAVGHIWSTMKSISFVTAYTALFLQDKYPEDFGQEVPSDVTEEN